MKSKTWYILKLRRFVVTRTLTFTFYYKINNTLLINDWEIKMIVWLLEWK